MGLELAKAYILIRADQRHLNADLAEARQQLIGTLQSIAQVAGAIPTAIDYVLQSVVRLGESTIGAALESIKIQTRLGAALEATGMSAKVSMNDLSGYATQLMNLTATDDEAIMGAMTRLTMFRSLSKETFKEVTKGAIGLSAMGFGTVESSAMRLGRALEDPQRGMSLLRRTGIMFTAAEQAKVKTLVAANKLHEAQGIILAKVAPYFKVAVDMAKTGEGYYRLLNVQIDNMREAIGEALLPLMSRLKEETLRNHYFMLAFAKVVGFAATYTGYLIPNVLTAIKVLKWLGLAFIGASVAMKAFGITFHAVLWGTGVGIAVSAIIIGIAAIVAAIQGAIRWMMSFKESQAAWTTGMLILKEVMTKIAIVFKAAFGGEFTKTIGKVFSAFILTAILGVTALAKALQYVITMMLIPIMILRHALTAMGLLTQETENTAAKAVAAQVAQGGAAKGQLGRTGFRDYGKSVQEMLLKNPNGTAEKQLREQQQSNELQKEQLKVQKQIRDGQSEAGVLA